ncbi:unnamed protein product [Adineta steineri]|uniref:SHSP domain-containing protein n=1 Tax=Adineta steineri TaxID=433720 RepID=A0A814ZGI2_9BILA|nr:unnamed protein product [Adineta steineri]CAF1242904.1 unnamed protein product [Adineta steineri]
MALARFSQRLFAPTTFCRLSLIGNKNGSVRYFFHRRHCHEHLPEAYFASTSNAFQRWEKEFERMQQHFNNYLQNLKPNRSIIDFPSSRNNNDLIITEADGSRKFQISLNTQGFEPDDIKIKIQNGNLIISAKKEKKANNNYSLHEFSQTYSLPEELIINDLKSMHTENGILSIEAPLPKEKPKTREINIERVK